MLKSQMKKLPRQGAVKVHKCGREVCSETAGGKREYKTRTHFMAFRQQFVCAICGLFMYYDAATFDHEKSRGGGKRDDRILVDGEWQNAAVHEHCNSLKGSKRYKWVNGFYKPVEKFKEKAA